MTSDDFNFEAMCSLEMAHEMLNMVGGFILGFNSTLDVVKRLTSSVIRSIECALAPDFHHLSERKIISIKSIEDVYQILFQGFFNYDRNQSMITNRRVFEFLCKEIGWEFSFPGGTPTNCLPFLSSLGIDRIVLYCNNLDKHIASGLPSGPLYFYENHGKFYHSFEICDLKHSSIHWIFECRCDDVIDFGKIDRKLFYTGKDRFVIGYNMSNMMIHPNFLNAIPALVNDHENLFISGYHILTDNSDFQAAVDSLKTFIGQIRNQYKPVNIHYEMSSFASNSCLKTMAKKIFPEIDSLGLEHNELSQLAYVLGISNSKDDDLFVNIQTLQKLQQIIQVPRIHFHCKDVSFGSFDREKFDEKCELKALLLGSLGATAYAAAGKLPPLSDWLALINVPFSKQGLKYASVFSTYNLPVVKKDKRWIILVVPNRLINNPKIVIGLGDLTSLLAFTLSATARRGNL